MTRTAEVERLHGIRWVPGPEGGILSQRFVAVVYRCLPREDCLLRRWVFARWQGTSVEALADHFLAPVEEVRAALCAAADMLRDNERALLAALIAEEREVLACLRNPSHKHPPQAPKTATWKADGSSNTPALPKVREDTPGGMAVERWEWLLWQLEH